MKELSKIVQDEHTYIESIGKHDKNTVREAISERGADTVIRVCIGVNGKEMPARALGYYASAMAVQERYLPEADIQFIYPVLTATNVNRVDSQKGKLTAENLDNAAHTSFPNRYIKDNPNLGNINSFIDGELPTEELEQAVGDVLETEPNITKRLDASAKARGSNFTQYVAAHVLMHDTNPLLIPLSGDKKAKEAARVISIGAQSERTFYLARMACRIARLLPENSQVATGQLFTRHVIAPYMSCREGESTLSQPISTNHPVPSIQRDMEYLHRALSLETIRYRGITV